MPSRAFIASVLALAGAALWLLAACGSVPTGPSLSNVSVGNLTTRPTIGDASVCCCHATGTITNRNSVAVHITITFAAMDKQGAQLGRTVFFVRDLQPGESQAFDAPGFLMPCASIDHISYELNVNGLAGTGL